MNKEKGSSIGKVCESSSKEIIIKMNFEEFESNKKNLKIGNYLKVQLGNSNYSFVVIKGIKAISIEDSNGEQIKDKYFINVYPIGTLEEDKFISGSPVLPSPTEEVFTVSKEELEQIFSIKNGSLFSLGKLSQNEDLEIKLDGDSFFSKHIGIVGSTGSGKSCTVAKILQEVVGIRKEKNTHVEKKKNAHIIIFDIHSEYHSAFQLEKEENFSLNSLDVETLKLPYWLMNSEELESLFIESNENNSHNQVSQFKKAVILNKRKYNEELKNITYDTPVFFDIKEVFNYITNLNNEVICKEKSNFLKPQIIEEIEGDEKIRHIKDKIEYFEKIYTFSSTSTKTNEKASNGAFNGEFNRFLSRLENKIDDERLKFLMKAEYKTSDFEKILKQFLGYINKANVTIVDLSGIPFEVLSITTSLISRIIFDFSFHYSKLHKTNDIPFMLVCEEAHNYVPKNGGAEYNPSKKSIERIAKEGRKYGLSLMVVSQRPSEVSETIFAQCNNFISLKLTNNSDQNYVKNFLINNMNSVADILPMLVPGECLVVGEAILTPTIVKIELPSPLPKSETIKVHQEWSKCWKEIDKKESNDKSLIEQVIEKWKR